MSKKPTTAQHALTHVKAYIVEVIQYEDHALTWMSPDYSNAYHGDKSDALDVAFYVDECIRDAKTFVELKRKLKEMYGKGPNSPERCYTRNIMPRIEAFYTAMKKVVPNIKYKSHEGTEDRGWWRVFDEITGVDPYFSSYDLGRDMMMAVQFRNTGAITVEQYQNHVTKRTLTMMRSKRFQTAGQPCANLLLGYAKEECRTDEFYDMRFINAIAA